MRSRILLFVVSAFIALSAAHQACAVDADRPASQPYEGARGRASRSMNAMLYGPAEAPLSREREKDPLPAAQACGRRNRTDVEKGIAGMITGVWQMATFWCPDSACGNDTGRSD